MSAMLEFSIRGVALEMNSSRRCGNSKARESRHASSRRLARKEPLCSKKNKLCSDFFHVGRTRTDCDQADESASSHKRPGSQGWRNEAQEQSPASCVRPKRILVWRGRIGENEKRTAFSLNSSPRPQAHGPRSVGLVIFTASRAPPCGRTPAKRRSLTKCRQSSPRSAEHVRRNRCRTHPRAGGVLG